MLTFRKHHTLKGDKNLHGEDLLSISKWAAMQNKGHSMVAWSLLGCLSKLGSKIGTIHHAGTWKIMEFTQRKCIHGTRGCKWLFNKGIQKSAVNAGLQGVQNRREGRRGEEGRRERKLHPNNQAHHLRAISPLYSPCILHITSEIFKQAYILKQSAGWFDCQKEPCWSCWERSGRQLSTFLH